MKKLLGAIAVTAMLAAATTASATTSTTFWTPATTYTQPYLVPHLTYDSYFGEKGNLANDYGLTVGVLPFAKLQGELGIRRVVFGPARRERGAVASESRRLHGEQDEEVVFEQRRHNRPLAELEAHSNWSAAKALAQALGPSPQLSRAMLDDRALATVGSGH